MVNQIKRKNYKVRGIIFKLTTLVEPFRSFEVRSSLMPKRAGGSFKSEDIPIEQTFHDNEKISPCNYGHCVPP